MVGDKRPDGSDAAVPGISQPDPTLLRTQEPSLSLDNLADPNAAVDNQSSPITEEMALPTRKSDETQPALSSKDTVESDEADDLERFSQLSEQTEETAVASPAGNHESPSPVVAPSHQTDSTVDGADSVDCANLPFTEKPVLPFASATQPLVTEQSPKQPLITDQLPSQMKAKPLQLRHIASEVF
ncbi:hypothetical protein EB796_013005 [Bugula neritina]|uniref:Uncharacterized protein n=1 Tax=Bugula neritina TaxID=10212 RepID=A0A7J7JSQ1_BUGNE|nr:hypothetical protein EB796_013005 [Bugula neritina]